MPLTALFVGMVICNNLCLKYVEVIPGMLHPYVVRLQVSFYQVARAWTVGFNILFSQIVMMRRPSPAWIDRQVLGESTSYKAMTACAVVEPPLHACSLSTVGGRRLCVRL